MMWFHLMPYPELPEDFNKQHRSVWVDIDPALFDRDVMADTYEPYIDQLVYAEECGFDGICVNEHHNNGYGLMPSPNLIASILASRTSRAAITVLGNSVALYNPPIRVAEEFAMLDLFSHGRLIAGFPVGTSMDTAYSYSVNPGQLRDKYYEGIELDPEGVAGHGALRLQRPVQPVRYVNPVPRPLAAAAPAGVDPRRRLGGDVGLLRRQRLRLRRAHVLRLQDGRETVGGYWRRVEEHGKDDNPHRLAVTQFIGVADTDRGLPPLPGAGRVLLQPLAPRLPGLHRPARLRHRGVGAGPLQVAGPPVARAKQAKHDLTWDEMVENGYVVIGSPDTVREKLEEAARELRIGHLCAMLQFGNMSDELTRYNTQALRRQGGARRCARCSPMPSTPGGRPTR